MVSLMKCSQKTEKMVSAFSMQSPLKNGPGERFLNLLNERESSSEDEQPNYQNPVFRKSLKQCILSGIILDKRKSLLQSNFSSEHIVEL